MRPQLEALTNIIIDSVYVAFLRFVCTIHVRLPMHAALSKVFERLSRARLSFGIGCFGMGVIVGGDLISKFNLSSGVVDLIGSLIAGLGIFFFGTNCAEEVSGKRK